VRLEGVSPLASPLQCRSPPRISPLPSRPDHPHPHLMCSLPCCCTTNQEVVRLAMRSSCTVPLFNNLVSARAAHREVNKMRQ
jgi:hypothetical protein